jgi:hypothetical protein
MSPTPPRHRVDTDLWTPVADTGSTPSVPNTGAHHGFDTDGGAGWRSVFNSAAVLNILDTADTRVPTFKILQLYSANLAFKV